MFGTLKKEYDINGYAIVRNVIDPELVSEVENHVHWLSKKHPETRQRPSTIVCWFMLL